MNRNTSPDIDLELVSQTLEGRTQAFGQLVERHQRRLVCALAQLTGSHEDALDQAQEAFLLAYQNLDRFRGESKFYSWLFRIAYHCAMNYHRRRKRAVSLDQVREERGFDAVDAEQTSFAEKRMIDLEDQELLSASLAELSDEHRQIISLKDLGDLSYEQIAEVLECPVGTVRSLLHRARMELRQIVCRKQKLLVSEPALRRYAMPE